MNSIIVLILIIAIFGTVIACCKYCYKLGYNTAVLEYAAKEKEEIKDAIKIVGDNSNLSSSELDDELQNIAAAQQRSHT